MAVALSPNELERTLEVLSNAGQTLQLTRFEKLSYRALLLSVDGMLVSFLLIMLILFLSGGEPLDLAGKLVGVLATFFTASGVVGIVSLMLNIPLLIKTFREARRLKRLGLNSLSTSLWKENRRGRWISRIRGILLISMGIVILMIAATALGGALMMGVGFGDRDERIILSFVVLFPLTIAALLFAARYLRNQRERMDLAASAEGLRKALLSLRQREGPEIVSVPAELLEQTARIESMAISNERKDAVLQSAASRPNAYAVAFSREAVQQRATLSTADRVGLEDLVAELSTNGAQFASQAQAIPGTDGPTFLGASKSKRVEIEYVIDRASRGIRVISVRPGAEASPAVLSGTGHV